MNRTVSAFGVVLWIVLLASLVGATALRAFASEEHNRFASSPRLSRKTLAFQVRAQRVCPVKSFR